MRKTLLVAWLVACTCTASAQTVGDSLVRPVPYSLRQMRLDPDDTYPRTVTVKANALMAAILVLNVAGEIDVDEHMTFHVPVYFSALNYFHSDIKFRTLAIMPGFRYWYSHHSGWYVGGHLGIGSWNFAAKGKYRFQDAGRQSPAYGGGLEAGYRWAFRRNSRWIVEAGLGVGVYNVRYDKFLNERNGPRTSADHHRTYFGPDQLTLAIGYTFDWKRKEYRNVEKKNP